MSFLVRSFIAYYYGTAPTHARFCTVRRALSLLNLFAFSVFILWPCMPPRLLPAEYGFVDTVNGEDAESVWMSGNYVNKLAAMPSMHFGYAACIGAVFIYESAVVHRLVRLLSIGWRVVGGATLARKVRGVAGRATRRCLPAGRKSMRLVPSDGNLEAAALSETSSESDSEEQRRTRSGEIRTTASPSVLDAHGNPIPLSELPLPYAEQESHRAFHWSDLLRFAFGVFYPSWILLTIVATANHYVADAVVALVGVGVAFACNRVLLNFLPAEDYLLWILRLDKPEPTTGWKRRERMVEEELKRREAERR